MDEPAEAAVEGGDDRHAADAHDRFPCMTRSPMRFPRVTRPVTGALSPRSPVLPSMLPGIPVFASALPSLISLPSSWPRMVSITAWTSPRGEPGAQADHDRGEFHGRAQVPLLEDRIHEQVGGEAARISACGSTTTATRPSRSTASAPSAVLSPAVTPSTVWLP